MKHFPQIPTFWGCEMQVFFLFFFFLSFPPRIGIITPIVPKCTTADWINYNKKNQENNIYHSNLFPIRFNVGKHTSLAWRAIVAKGILVVWPGVAVCVSRVVDGWLDPHCLTLVREVTITRWLATARLLFEKKTSSIINRE